MASREAGNQLQQHGLSLIVNGLIQNLKASPHQQVGALKALQDLLRRQPLSSIQVAFRDAKGFPQLVAVLQSPFVDEDTASTHHGASRADSLASWQSEGPSSHPSTLNGGGLLGPVVAGRTPGTPPPARPVTHDDRVAAAVLATSVLMDLIRNNAVNRQTALAAGALTTLSRMIASSTSPQGPISIDVLRCLYMFVSVDSSGYLTPELIQEGSVAALCRMLQQCLDEQLDREEEWATEVLCILHVLARRSRAVAVLLTGKLQLLVQLLSTAWQPITLSLGLDILEELLLSSDSATLVQDFVVARGLQATLRVLQLHGLGSKVLLLWSRMCSDALFKAVFVHLLAPDDVQELVQLASRACEADDLDATAGRVVLQAVADANALALLRQLVVAQCLSRGLQLEGLSATLEQISCSPTGAALIGNLSAQFPAQVAVAAACLLHRAPQLYKPLLLQHGLMRALISSACDQCCGIELPSSVPCTAPSRLMFSETSEVSVPTAVRDSIRRSGSGAHPSKGQESWHTPQGALQQVLDFTQQHARRPSRTLSFGSNVGSPQSAAVRSPRAVQPAVEHPDGIAFESLKFIVAGREFYALSWLLESSSPVVSRMMSAHPPGTKFQSIAVPEVPGVDAGRQYTLFGMAVEYLYTGGNVEPPADALLDLWAMATTLEITSLQQHCESRLASNVVLASTGEMHTALTFADMFPDASAELQRIAVSRLLQQLRGRAGDPALGLLLSQHRNTVLDVGAALLECWLASTVVKVAPAAHTAVRSAHPVKTTDAGTADDTQKASFEFHSARVNTQASHLRVHNGVPGTHDSKRAAALNGSISADSAVDWSRQLSGVFVKNQELVRGEGRQAVVRVEAPSAGSQ